MLLELSSLNQLPVGSFEEGGLIGQVKKSIISKDEGKVLGFLIKARGWFAKEKIASFEDIISIDQAGVVIRSSESLVDADEIVRIAQILKSKFNLIGLRARSKDGTNLGNVTDALIESDSGDIMRLYVKHFLRSFVFERSQIDEITLKYVVLHLEMKKKIKEPSAVLAEPKIA